MRSAGDGRAILAVLQRFANVAGAMMWFLKEGCRERVDFFGWFGGVDQKVDREVGSNVSEAGGCEEERGRRVAQAERYYVVRVCDVLGEVNGVVGEGVNGLASNLVGRVGWRRVLHGKTKELNTTIEMVKRIWFKP